MVWSSSSMAARDSPVEITSSTMRMRLPFKFSQSALERYSFCTWSVVMDFTSTWMGSSM